MRKHDQVRRILVGLGVSALVVLLAPLAASAAKLPEGRYRPCQIKHDPWPSCESLGRRRLEIKTQKRYRYRAQEGWKRGRLVHNRDNERVKFKTGPVSKIFPPEDYWCEHSDIVVNWPQEGIECTHKSFSDTYDGFVFAD